MSLNLSSTEPETPETTVNPAQPDNPELSEARRRAARENGARSQGPTSESGRQRSSKNAIKHGFYGKDIVLVNESPELFHQLLNDYLTEWQPVGRTENDLLTEMVVNRWFLQRAWAKQTGALNTEMFVQKPSFDDSLDDTNAAMRQADAMIAMGIETPQALESMHKWETRFSRAYERAMKNLIRLQTMRLARQAAEQRAQTVETTENIRNIGNEPKPDPDRAADHRISSSATAKPLATTRKVHVHLKLNYVEGPSLLSNNAPEEQFTFDCAFTPTEKRPSTDRRHWTLT